MLGGNSLLKRVVRQLSQKSCGCFLSGFVQGQSYCGPGQPDLVAGSAAHVIVIGDS